MIHRIQEFKVGVNSPPANHFPSFEGNRCVDNQRLPDRNLQALTAAVLSSHIRDQRHGIRRRVRAGSIEGEVHEPAMETL